MEQWLESVYSDGTVCEQSAAKAGRNGKDKDPHV